MIQSMPQTERRYLNVIYSEWIYTGLSVLIIAYLPESPRWYLRKGKKDKARKALSWLNGSAMGYNLDRELAVMEYELHGDLHRASEDAKISYMELFRGVNLVRWL